MYWLQLFITLIPLDVHEYVVHKNKNDLKIHYDRAVNGYMYILYRNNVYSFSKNGKTLEKGVGSLWEMRK